MGEEKVQTIKFSKKRSSENCSGKHNPKVAGSSPVSATSYNLQSHSTLEVFF